jgi:putative redox protein
MWITYSGSLRTEALHLSSGEKIFTDAPLDNYGLGKSFSPTDLLCTSLASCMLTIMGILADKLQVELGDTTLEIEKIMQDKPRKVAEIKVKFVWNPKRFKPEVFLQLKDAALNCPVYLSLHPDIKKTIDFGE